MVMLFVFVISKYVIYCDESDRKGKNYSYFYGALAFDVNNFAHLENYLKSNKVTISQSAYNGELKWSKISNSKEDEYLYKNFIDAIFQ